MLFIKPLSIKANTKTNVSNKMKCVLVTLCTDDWVNQAKQVFSSAYFDGNWRDDFCIIGYHLSRENKKWFLDHGIDVFEVEHIYDRPERITFHPSHLLKHNIFSTYFKKWDYVLYLDADTMCMKDINQIKMISEENKDHILFTPAGKVMFKTIRSNLKKNISSNLKKMINEKIDVKSITYNGGVFAFSTNLISDTTISEMKEFGDPLLDAFRGDQVLLSIFWHDKIKKINSIWNNVEPLTTNKESYIYHFIGNTKPWMNNYLSKNWKFIKKWEENLGLANKINNHKINKINNFIKI